VQRLNSNEYATSSLTGADLTFPVEYRFDEVEQGNIVRLELEARDGDRVVVARATETTVIGRRSLLLPITLDASCASVAAPTCEAPLTCARGKCIDPEVASSSLTEYSEDWADDFGNDICKRAGDEPTVILGEGQADYLAADDGTVAQVEAGPQGGYHIWIASRIKGLARAGSVTVVKGEIPSLDYTVPPYSVVFTLNPDEGNFCKIFGLRLRLDDDTHKIDSLLGREVDVTVEITDPSGTTGVGTKRFVLSNDIL
jgi:hypothetical protein